MHFCPEILYLFLRHLTFIMFALFPSLFVILATMSSVESSPLVTVPTFPSGAGNLAVLSAGQQVGCLTPQWKMAIDATLCGTFDAKALPGAQTYYNINSIEGACGFRYQYNRTILAENAQYIIGCGSSAGDINPELEVSFFESPLSCT